jgi:hypothetical protein
MGWFSIKGILTNVYRFQPQWSQYHKITAAALAAMAVLLIL